jgi:hypothetical protein
MGRKPHIEDSCTITHTKLRKYKGMQVRGPAPKAPSTHMIKFCMHQLGNQLSSFIVSNRVAGATSTTEVPSSHDDEGLWQSP